MADRRQNCRHNASAVLNSSVGLAEATVDASNGSSGSVPSAALTRKCDGRWPPTCDGVAAAHRHTDSCCRRTRRRCSRTYDYRCVAGTTARIAAVADSDAHPH